MDLIGLYREYDYSAMCFLFSLKYLSVELRIFNMEEFAKSKKKP